MTYYINDFVNIVFIYSSFIKIKQMSNEIALLAETITRYVYTGYYIH